MEKLKIKILVGMLIFISVILIISKICMGITIGGHNVETDKDLAELASSNPDDIFNWKFDSSKDYKLTIAGGTIEEHTATCMYHQQSDLQNGQAGYDYVTDVIDIEGNSITINGKIIGTNDTQKKYIAAMAYAINSAYQKKDATNTEGKTAFRYLFQLDTVKDLLKKRIDDAYITGESNGGGSNDVCGKALDYGDNLLEYDAMEKLDSTVKITEKGNYTYIGPFKMETNKNDIDKLTLEINQNGAVGTGEITEVYKKEDGKFISYGEGNIPTGKPFYVRVKAENIIEWKLTISGHIQMYKARILLITNRRAKGQNLAIYVAKNYTKTSDLTWDGTKKNVGSLKIYKKNENRYKRP